MYEDLVKALREHADKMCVTFKGAHACGSNLALDAADAIERMDKALEDAKEYESFWEKEANEALRKFQVAVASKPRWIPVTERLPEKYHQVLVYGLNGMQIDYYAGEKSIGGHPLFMISETKATHWQPLPEPPKEET